jgi:predicted GH43/DUF377 family glycosyl hydrolase
LVKEELMFNPDGYKPIPVGTTGGWRKPLDKPLFDPGLGTVFDNYVIKEGSIFKMWYSWRPARAIVYTTSNDGITWTLPKVVLTRLPGSAWENSEVSRPTLVYKDETYYMWYTGHNWTTPAYCAIGLVTSKDGIHWERHHTTPVLAPDLPWERNMIWCPHVIYDKDENIFKMWYSGGATDHAEADAIAYATSKDGIHWIKDGRNPIFLPVRNNMWEMYKVSASYVWQRDGWYYMTYLGSDSDMRAYSGLARSRDGITNWERHPSNPIIAGTEGSWDWAGICKVTVMETETGYIGWYNGCNNKLEEMGLVIHDGFDLGFTVDGKPAKNERGDVAYIPPINAVI